jgi:hypothetical protein
MTLVKTFTLRFNPEHMQFDDTVLGEFVREHLVISMKTEFFYFREEPLWSVMVTYRDQHTPSNIVAGVAQDLSRSRSKKEGRQMLPKPKIDEHQRVVYEKLRLWRNEIARAKGHPPGNLFTNRQLHEIVELNPHSIKQLTKVHGVGTYKATTYGREILEFLSVLNQYTDPMASTAETESSPVIGKTSQSASEPRSTTQTSEATAQTRVKNQQTGKSTVQTSDSELGTNSPVQG